MPSPSRSNRWPPAADTSTPKPPDSNTTSTPSPPPPHHSCAPIRRRPRHRRHPAGRHRRQPRPDQQRRRIRQTLRSQPAQSLQRQNHPPPPQPRRQPRRQPSPARHPGCPATPTPAHPRLPRPPPRRRQNQKRDHAMPQTLHRPRNLSGRPRIRSPNDCPNIGASGIGRFIAMAYVVAVSVAVPHRDLTGRRRLRGSLDCCGEATKTYRCPGCDDEIRRGLRIWSSGRPTSANGDRTTAELAHVVLGTPNHAQPDPESGLSIRPPARPARSGHRGIPRVDELTRESAVRGGARRRRAERPARRSAGSAPRGC